MQPGVRQRAQVGRGGVTSGRPVPNEYAEAVEGWARAHGGHAKIKWLAHPMNCWAVILSYKVGDPRAEDKRSEGEPVLLHDYWTAKEWEQRSPRKARRHKRTNAIMPGNYAYELDELGVEGIIARLDRGNMLSGRGEFGKKTLEQVGLDTVTDHRSRMEKIREKKRDDAGARARDKRRTLLKIPFLPVGISFGKNKEIVR